MEQSNNRKTFLINLTYWAVILALVYLVFRYVIELLMPFVIALVVAWILRPWFKFLRKRLNGKLAAFITAVSVVFCYLVVGSLVLLLVAGLISDLADYLTDLPALFTRTIEPGLRNVYLAIEEFLSRFDPNAVSVLQSVLPQVISSISSAVTSFSVSAVTRITGVATKLPSFLIASIICIISTIFMVTTFDGIKRFLRANLPPRVTEVAGYICRSFKKVIMQYGRSYLLILLITFAELAVGLLIIGVHDAILIALLIAIMDIFPIVGTGLILVPWAVISFIQGNILRGIGLAILYIVIIVIRQIIEPKIIGKHVGLPPLVTLICMFVGTSLFGGLGLLGLPILAAIACNLNNDPDVPLSLFKTPGEGENAELPPGKISYRFKPSGKKKKDPKDSEK